MKILSLFIFKLHKLTMFQSFLAKKKNGNSAFSFM